MLTEKVHTPICLSALVLTVVEIVTVIGWRIFGPSYPFSMIFAMVTGVTFYYCVTDFLQKKRGITLSVIVLVVLQLLLYIVSEFIKDYTRFNLYFVIDFLLMITMCSQFFWLKREENE